MKMHVGMFLNNTTHENRLKLPNPVKHKQETSGEKRRNLIVKRKSYRKKSKHNDIKLLILLIFKYTILDEKKIL